MRLKEETIELVIARIFAALIGVCAAALTVGFMIWSRGTLDVWKVVCAALVGAGVGVRSLWIAYTGDSTTLNALRERSEEVRARTRAYHANELPADYRTHEQKIRDFREALFQATLEVEDSTAENAKANE